MNNSRNIFRAAISLGFAISVLLVSLSSVWAQNADERDVQDAVERFLVTIGDGDLDKLPAMFVPKANIGTASLREGKWVSSTMTFEEWFTELKAQSTWTRYREPVSKFTVHVESGQLAFVRADATFIVDGQVLSHNIDYFTLVRDEGVWRFLNASYVATPVETNWRRDESTLAFSGR